MSRLIANWAHVQESKNGTIFNLFILLPKFQAFNTGISEFSLKLAVMIFEVNKTLARQADDVINGKTEG